MLETYVYEIYANDAAAVCLCACVITGLFLLISLIYRR